MILAIEAYNNTVMTEDRLEGVRAFNEKRKPGSRDVNSGMARRPSTSDGWPATAMQEAS